jgi:hypothetical protein
MNPRVRRGRQIASAAILVLCAAAAHAEAAGEYRTVEVESLRITVDSEWVPAAGPGYLPVRWDITNLGDDRLIEIVGNGSRALMHSRRYRQSQPVVRQRVRLGAGDRVRFTMNVPASGDSNGVGFNIREQDRTIQTLGFVNTNRLAGISALIVAAPNGTYAAAAPAWVRPMSYAYGAVTAAPAAPATHSAAPPLDLVLEPARLPGSWLGYTSVQALVIGPREWEIMEAAQRGAVLTWVACGGSLVLVDAALDTLFPDPQQRPAVSGNVAEHFFGRIHLFTSAEIDRAGLADTLSAMDKAVRDPAWALPIQTVSFPGGFRLPIPGVSVVPAGAYLTLLVLFTVLIGPVNQVLLRRRGQQTLIVLTTPLIAGAFIVLLGAYVAIVEGFSVRGRAVSLTLLDQPASQAVTRATASIYAAGRAPSAGLRFGRDVAVVPTPPADAPPVSEVLDLSETQQYASGFLRARTPTNFETLEHRAARERLTFSRQNGRLRVSNGLGSTVTRLHVRHGGRIYELSDVLAPGGASLLQESPAPAGSPLLGGDAAVAHLAPIAASLPDGAYLALLERSPFWSGGTPDIDEHSSLHLVLGRPGPLP